PFKNDPSLNQNIEIIWLKPKLVCNIYFTEKTSEGSFRHPVFIALRDDKRASEVHIEDTQEPVYSAKSGSKKMNVNNNMHHKEKQVKKTINGNQIELTNLHKVLWPDDGYTKGDMLEYY